MELVVYETPEQMANGAANRIAELIGDSSDRFTIGLAGGSTPRVTYNALRANEVAWDRIDAYLSDERWVPPDDERSNGRMASETLIDQVGARLHSPRWSEHLEPSDAAAYYEAMLRSLHHDHRPNLVLLGLGEDGHTASLFPGSPALNEDKRWFVANLIPATGEQRLTVTYPFLWSAERIVVLVAGEGKAPALRDSFAGATPAGRLSEGDAEVEWHVDRAAASLHS
jgi:6-phosphogluconolactonase